MFLRPKHLGLLDLLLNDFVLIFQVLVSGSQVEGLTVMKGNDSGYKVLFVYDGIARGNPTLFEVSH